MNDEEKIVLSEGSNYHPLFRARLPQTSAASPFSPITSPSKSSSYASGSQTARSHHHNNGIPTLTSARGSDSGHGGRGGNGGSLTSRVYVSRKVQAPSRLNKAPLPLPQVSSDCSA